jgi:hypothetical protein
MNVDFQKSTVFQITSSAFRLLYDQATDKSPGITGSAQRNGIAFGAAINAEKEIEQ